MRYSFTARLARLWHGLQHDEGGWITAALLGAQAVGSLLGRGAKGSADARFEGDKLNVSRDRNEIDKYGIGQNAQMQLGNLDLQRKQFSEGARGNRARQAAFADLLGSGPIQVNAPGFLKGHMPNMALPQLGEGGRMGLQLMQREAMQKMLDGDQFEGGEMLRAPRASPLSKPGLLEKLGGIAGTIGGLAGGLNQTGLFSDRTVNLPQGLPDFGMPSELPGEEIAMGGLPEQYRVPRAFGPR